MSKCWKPSSTFLASGATGGETVAYKVSAHRVPRPRRALQLVLDRPSQPRAQQRLCVLVLTGDQAALGQGGVREDEDDSHHLLRVRGEVRRCGRIVASPVVPGHRRATVGHENVRTAARRRPAQNCVRQRHEMWLANAETSGDARPWGIVEVRQSSGDGLAGPRPRSSFPVPPVAPTPQTHLGVYLIHGCRCVSARSLGADV